MYHSFHGHVLCPSPVPDPPWFLWQSAVRDAKRRFWTASLRLRTPRPRLFGLPTGGRKERWRKSMSEPIVLGFPRSTFVQIVRLVLTHKDVSYTFRDLEPEMGKPAHLALHPFKRV